MRIAAAAIGGLLAASCGDAVEPAPAVLGHAAYVWQRGWTGPVRAAVAAAPAELVGLRVLVLELGPTGGEAWPAVDAASLAAAARPVTAVIRIDGSRPIVDVPIGPVLARIAAWRARGVEVAGLEIDHDCATAALADYAAWLGRTRPPAPLAWSITALPTWTGSPDLRAVAAAVDELVVQVHAIAAPRLFEARQARAWLDGFAAAAPGHALRVALPTYRVVVAGRPIAADPVEVAALVRDLERRPVPGLLGVVWFRLPIDSDLATWRTPTLRAVIAGAPLAADVRIALAGRGPRMFDVIATNAGTLDAPYPAIAITGDVDAVDLVAPPAHRVLAAGSRVVAGWATGVELVAHAR